MCIAKMASAWIEHVRKWAKANGKTYACAMSDPECKKAYTGNKPAKPMKEATPKNPLKGRAMRKKYIAGENAKDAMAAFKAMKKAKNQPGMIGLSPGRVSSM
jgi:hypothetical protein